ncbi:MAG TPA: 8-amino-7-oxononanoate synthase [Sulfurihydrogenibium sp.]|uniref:8-amino-7-oxononanoate synthase n=1 Tax=Sulfurihydrogenibium sp. (strain YO3AOP1) TaxID=436114 RepID=UPI0001725212|nr:8-amino-7-oxononanoate synthase [Sulfurihydrogenibium sp. YO3AOP1]ACD65962.1 8-amino-7-oxononanoate synthase [Sulfurihydrogenibium sp. YO3AOP1]HBT98527.1 8-amino-7-oxononanoate synthase [Sulfurihydrogenibium sp.]
MLNLDEILSKKLQEIKQKNRYRARPILNENVVNFSSNDYLSLRDNPIAKQKLIQNIDKLSLGSGASVLVSGYHLIQRELEKFISEFKQTEDCIVVGSGYMANVGLIQAISDEEDIIFSDELNHASIIDGIRISKAKKIIYKHCDVEDLEEKLKKYHTKGKKIIITDGVFSMEGDIAPLDKIVEISKKYDAIVIVDDAHATGVIGEEGRGSLNYFNLMPDNNIIQIGTLSKAVGSYGAFICGSRILIDYLVNTIRSVIFTTGLSPIQNFISLENFKILAKEDFRRKEVLEKSKYLANSLKNKGIDVKFFGTPIISLIVGEEEKALKLRDKLLEKGFFVQAIRPPTVPEGTSRLRITINYNHSYEDIERLCEAIAELLMCEGVRSKL